MISAGTGWSYALALVGAVNSAIAFGYYGTVLREIWMKPVPDDVPTGEMKTPSSLNAALLITGTATVLLGVLPGIVLRFGDLTTITGAILGQ
ncbi:MAG: hypothetical protein R2715_00465 [Ilumatobacteraceae bacterium]